MLRKIRGFKGFFVLAIVFTTYTCIDPYIPKLGNYTSILVVDGLITNENRSYTVKLSYTTREKDSISKKISDATVSISDEDGNITNLVSTGNGIYRTDSLSFQGASGKSYQLHIATSDGEEYLSDTCKMFPVPAIDSLFYAKDQKVIENENVKRDGISIYLNTSKGPEDKYFLRWAFEETWKFIVPNPTRCTYINDSTIFFLPLSEVHETCWKQAGSTEILTGSMLKGVSSAITGQPLTFICPSLSNRLSVRYSILVKQYSVSQKEYNYWNNLKKMSETQGDIFGSQPFAVPGNVRNINNPEEQVLGYFQVSTATQKRIYINLLDIVPYQVTLYHYPCKVINMSPSRFPRPSIWAEPPTFDQIYEEYTRSGFAFVMPVYIGVTAKLDYIVFTTKECADCELSGTSAKPDFWTDN